MSLIGRIKPGAMVRPGISADVCNWPHVFGVKYELETKFKIVHWAGDLYLCYPALGVTSPYAVLIVHGNGIVLKGPYAVAKPHVEDWDETRVDIIGQNGNDGLHYPLRDS